MSDIYGSKPYTPKKLDHSSGHAFLSANGDIFYSPNSSRQVEVPVMPSNPYYYPFHIREAKFENFLSPRWWTKPYHYLSFVTLRPSFEGIIFGCLRDIVQYVELVDGGRYALATQRVDKWMQLEDSLIMIAHFLTQAYPTRVRAALKPIAPSLLGFGKFYYSHRSARLRAALARDWFLMWMSLVSSKIADIETWTERDNRGDWFSVLVEQNIPQDWLSAIQSSMVCNFSQQCPRVGTFLNVLEPQPDQPSVEWFYSWNIPVWYCFGPSVGYHKLEHLRPPSHILQAATTFMSKSPSPYHPTSPRPLSPPRLSSSHPSPPPPPREYSQREYEKARDAYLATKPWEAFFTAREERNKKILLNETVEDRTTRLNRERQPPRTSAHVFIWEWSDDGAMELVRTRVIKKQRDDVLNRYSKSQCVYDSVSNVWDVCEFFGDYDPNDDDDDDVSIYDDDFNDNYDTEPHADPDNVQEEHQAFIAERVRQSASSLQFTTDVVRASDALPEVDLTHAANELDVLRYLSHYYGFVHPLPLPNEDPAKINLADWDDCLQAVGLRTGKYNPPLPGFTSLIIAFVKRLKAHVLTASEWELSEVNRRCLSNELVAKAFRKLGEGFYLLDTSFLDNEIASEWQIAVTTSVNALYILRYILEGKDIPSTLALSRHLAEEGIPFRTFFKLEPLASSISLDAIETKIPRRVANYQFVPEDYETYVAYRKHLLATPRARAAILCGGIVGRLAKEHLDVESAVFGPSSVVTSHRLGYSVEVAGTTYWDDGLTNDEIAAICGMHHCYTGNGDQIAQVSWWPLPHYWEYKDNVYNWGHWTELDEIWYQERLSNIRQGDKKKGLPLVQKKWRDALRKYPAWRKVTARILEMSNKRFDPSPSP